MFIQFEVQVQIIIAVMVHTVTRDGQVSR